MKAKFACIAGLSVGLLALLLTGGEPPTWLLRLECLLFSVAALAWGYTAFAPKAPDWIWTKPVLGIFSVYLGCGAMFIDPRFVVSAVFIGIGTRLIMTTPIPRVTTTKEPKTAIGQGGGEIVLHEAGGIVIRD